MTFWSRKDSNRKPFKVAVIGGGFGGIAAAAYLKRSGISDITILEASEGIGGTWWGSRFPGAEVDTPSHLYSLSFSHFDWSRSHAGRDELQSYLELTVKKLDLLPLFRFNSRVSSVEWRNEPGGYVLTTASGEREYFDGVISAVGFLNVPNIPALRGADQFKGRIVHSAEWPDDLDLTGAKVCVVGAGSTAVQIVPQAAKAASDVSVFQREANWILPKKSRDFNEQQQRFYRLGPIRWWRRFRFYLKSEKGRVWSRQATDGTWANRTARRKALAHLHAGVLGREDLAEVLTPGYPFGGKRPVINDDFYPSLLEPNVHLIPHAVTSLLSDAVVDSSGETHACDVLVLATGYRAAEYLNGLTVTGVDGKDLHDTWADEPAAFLGTTVPGFPNFFMIYGPNTNAGPVVFMLECQARFAARSFQSMCRKGGYRTDLREPAYSAFNSWLQRQLEKTVWASTSSYYKSASGRIVTQWPFTATFYWFLCWVLRPLVMRVSKRFRPQGDLGRPIEELTATARD